MAFAQYGRQIRIDWERLKNVKEIIWDQWDALKEKPFFLNAKMNQDIFQLDYEKIEESFAKMTGPPHSNQIKLKKEWLNMEAQINSNPMEVIQTDQAIARTLEYLKTLHGIQIVGQK